MALSKREQEQLAALQKKAEEPERSPANISFSLDLGNDNAFARAVKLGLIPSDDDNQEEAEEEEGTEEAPRGRGYFG